MAGALVGAAPGCGGGNDPCAAFRLPDGGLHFFSMGVAYIPPACEDYLLDGGK